jgi:hypothetical protein
VTLWWYYRTLVLSRSWQTPLALASGLAELGLAALGGGVGGAIREARAVAADLARPWAVAADPTITSGRQLYERLLLSLSCATSYTYAYGPLSGVVQFALFAPCEALAAIGRGPSLLDPFRAATLLCAWLLFHLGEQRPLARASAPPATPLTLSTCSPSPPLRRTARRPPARHLRAAAPLLLPPLLRRASARLARPRRLRVRRLAARAAVVGVDSPKARRDEPRLSRD